MHNKKTTRRPGTRQIAQDGADRLNEIRRNWEGFEVGSSMDFIKEVERTGKNKKLMKFLAARRKSAKTAAIPLAEVRKQLGLD